MFTVAVGSGKSSIKIKKKSFSLFGFREERQSSGYGRVVYPHAGPCGVL